MRRGERGPGEKNVHTYPIRKSVSRKRVLVKVQGRKPKKRKEKRGERKWQGKSGVYGKGATNERSN